MDWNKRKHEGHSVPVHSKKPYHGDVRPGQEYHEPRLYQQPDYDYDDVGRQGTDFTQWSEAEIKAFLDERGGDFDDCTSFEQLVVRAVETEANTGPARRPQAGGAADAADGQAAADAAASGEQDESAAAAATPAAGAAAAVGDVDEYDPLEAFMAEINQEVAANRPNQPAGAQQAAQACDEAADPATEYMAVRAARCATSAAAIAADFAAAGYDSDEEVYATAKALQQQAEADGKGGESDDDVKAAAAKHRTIDPLAPVDHSSLEYDDFAKDFYIEHPTIAAMSEQQVRELRRELQVHVSGFDPPKPVHTFGQAGFDHLLLGAIKKAGYDKPTAIQAQALPAVLSGRDVLGLAKTGSGKTAAFVLPMLVHIIDQPELGKGEGPVGLILAPTRELSEQIHKETRKFSKPYGLRAVAAFGGLSKFDQFKELKSGCEIAVATPGRMMDLIRMKACTTQRVTYLVLDEADRMFDMGFEQQVRSLLGVVRPDRQTLLFSATLPRRIESLVGEALSNPVRISVGQLGAANQDVTQRVEVLAGDAEKLAWLTARLPGFIDEGDVLLFVGQRAKCDSVTQALHAAGFKAAAIHGDMDQFSRMAVLDSFRSGQAHLLVATDVAARGLDIKSIKTVINYDAARDIDTHIHRVGRTGRAGDKEGVAVTLLLEGANKDTHFAGLLVNSLTLGGQEVPHSLYALAMKDSRFRQGSSRHKGGKWGKGGRRKPGPNVGGAGLGFGPKPPQPPQQQQQQQGAADGFAGGSNSAADMVAAGGDFKQLPGFARSHDDYEHESSAAAAAPLHNTQQQQQQPWSAAAAGVGVGGSSLPFKFPPPPTLPPGPSSDGAAAAGCGVLPPPSAAVLPPAAVQLPVPAQPALPPGPPPSEAAPAAAAAATGHQQAEQQQQDVQEQPGTMAAARKELLQAAYGGRMRSGFVSSGVRGGDIGQSATIVAPKLPSSQPAVAAAAAGDSTIAAPPAAAGGRPVFRPPVPVTQRPMYLTRPTETITKGGRGLPRQQQQAAAALQSAAAQQAVAAAQAVAARLAAQAAGLPAAAQPAADSYQQQQAAPWQPQQAAQRQQQQQYQQYQQPQLYGQQPAQQHFPQPPQQPVAGLSGSVADAVAAAQAIAARLAAQHPGST